VECFRRSLLEPLTDTRFHLGEMEMCKMHKSRTRERLKCNNKTLPFHQTTRVARGFVKHFYFRKKCALKFWIAVFGALDS